MKGVIFLILILTITACSFTTKPTEAEISTDTIAEYWSGEVTGNLDNGDELPPRDIQIIIIAGCTFGKVYGKSSEDDQCPGEIILLKVDGNQYNFISETVSGTRHICGKGDNKMIDLELQSDGTIYSVYHNGATLTGILQRK